MTSAGQEFGQFPEPWGTWEYCPLSILLGRKLCGKRQGQSVTDKIPMAPTKL
jgi:hypothetical protein